MRQSCREMLYFSWFYFNSGFYIDYLLDDVLPTWKVKIPNLPKWVKHPEEEASERVERTSGGQVLLSVWEVMAISVIACIGNESNEEDEDDEGDESEESNESTMKQRLLIHVLVFGKRVFIFSFASRKVSLSKSSGRSSVLGVPLSVLLVFALIHVFFGVWFHLELTPHSSRQ